MQGLLCQDFLCQDFLCQDFLCQDFYVRTVYVRTVYVRTFYVRTILKALYFSIFVPLVANRFPTVSSKNYFNSSSQQRIYFFAHLLSTSCSNFFSIKAQQNCDRIWFDNNVWGVVKPWANCVQIIMQGNTNHKQQVSSLIRPWQLRAVNEAVALLL